MLFKIAKADTSTSFYPGFAEAEGMDARMLSQLCVSEDWIGDLANGVLRLGERAAVLHGLDSSECGLLTMMRCYEARDRAYILELFEQAATTSCSFCFSSTIISKNGYRQPVFCIGESSGLEQRASGSMVGLFIFPRFKLSTVPRLADTP